MRRQQGEMRRRGPKFQGITPITVGGSRDIEKKRIILSVSKRTESRLVCIPKLHGCEGDVIQTLAIVIDIPPPIIEKVRHKMGAIENDH
jgi:hypothetical protein